MCWSSVQLARAAFCMPLVAALQPLLACAIVFKSFSTLRHNLLAASVLVFLRKLAQRSLASAFNCSPFQALAQCSGVTPTCLGCCIHGNGRTTVAVVLVVNPDLFASVLLADGDER